MVVIGGLTRLTNSGLSITEWELFKGILPPLNSEAWNSYFSLYKKIPQYELIYNNMSLEEFKIIFFWEYFHRIWGRFIGIFFLVPLIYFYLTKKINPKYIKTCFVILSLIIFQGIVGWYMVKSGLVNKITVSHYRLSMHLSIAFIIISLIYWIILNFKRNTSKFFFSNDKKNYIFLTLIFMIFIQIVIGAFVSGLDAGQIYQTWPLMNYTYFPNDIETNELKNFLDFDNHSLIQFYHRNIAYLILFYVLCLGTYIFKNNIQRVKAPFYFVIFVLTFQIFLGIITLLSGLNIYIALGHQIGSLFLILSTIYLYYSYIN
jgi:cytochrome c oxidase assembly protein subunit 15